VRKTEKLLLETKKASIKVIREHTDALEESTESSQRLTKTFNGLHRATAGFIGALVGLGASFTNELVNGSDRLSDFTKHIPVFGTVFTPLVKFIETTVDNFRMLSSVGAAFGNSLEELRRTAAMARLPLDEFTALIQNNSERLIFLGSTVSDGARRFAEIAGELRGNDGLFGALKAMGFTTEEVNEGLANYINLQGRLGSLQQRSNSQLVAGAAEYLMQMDRLAKVTGRQRQEIERDLERLSLDAGVRTLEQNLEQMFGDDSQEVRNFRANLGLISSLPAEMQDAARSMMLGLPTEDAAKLMALGGEELNRALQAAAEGADPDILRRALAATAENISRTLPDGRSAATLIEGFRRIDPALAAIYDYAFQFRRLGEADLDAAVAEQAQRDGIIENLTRFDDRIRDIRTTIQTALIESGIFELLATSVSSLAGLINGPEGMSAIRNGIESMTNFFAGFIDDITTMGFWSAITNAFVDLAMNTWREISLRLFGGTRDTSDQQSEINNRIQNLESRRSEIASASRSGTGTDEQRRDLAALDAQIEQLRLRSASLADQHGAEVEGVLSRMFSNLFNGSNHREIEESLAPINEAIGNLEEQRNRLLAQGEFEIANENTGAELERINQELRELNEQRDTISAERQSGFLSELFTLENMFSTGGVLLLGLAAGAAAIALIGTKAALVAVAIGFTAGGIGYLLENLKPVIDSVFTGMATVIDSVGENIQGIMDSLSGGFTSTIEALTPMMERVFDGIGSIIDSLGENIQGIMDSLSGGFTSTIEALTPMMERVFDGIGSIIDSLGENIQGIMDSFSGGFTSAVEALTPMMERVFDGIGSTIDSVGGNIQGIIDSFSGGFTSAVEALTPMMERVFDGIGSIIDSLGENIQGVMDSFSGGFTSAVEALTPMMERVFDGIGSIIDSLGENIQGIMDSFSGGFTSAVEALTPMIGRVFDGIGSTIDSVGGNIQGIIDSLSGGFTSAVQELTPMIGRVFDGIGSTIDSVGGNIQGIIDSLSGGFTSAVQELTPLVNTVFNGISEVIESVGGTIQNTITSITDGISNIIGRITDFRTAGTDATTNQIERLSQIESERLVAAAEGINAIKTALEGFGPGVTGILGSIGSIFSGESAEERQTSTFERLANLGPGLTETGQALNEIASIEGLSENINSLSENLNSRSLRNYNSELRTMLEILRQINDELSRDTRRTNWRGQVVDQSETANPAASMLSQGTGSSSGTESRLDRLNTTMSELLRVAQEQLSVLSNIEDNTDDMSGGDISLGGITVFRGGR
jgi:phage-related protein